MCPCQCSLSDGALLAVHKRAKFNTIVSWFGRLDLMVLDTKGGPLALPDLWDRVYVQASMDSALVVLPTAR